jgi:DNA-binding cell septation regulator SpoVG
MSIPQAQQAFVKRVTLFPTEEGATNQAVAAVTMDVGPVTIRARLRKSGDRMYLSMPARKGSDNRWWDHCSIYDSTLKAQLETQAVQMYHAAAAQTVEPREQGLVNDF